jgi:hypothetical protein
MAGKESLARANRAKNDEFYTQLADVEAELRHYRDQFRHKVVFCNCDDPYGWRPSAGGKAGRQAACRDHHRRALSGLVS